MTPVVEPLELGEIALPPWHPRHHDGTTPIRSFAVRHPDGVVLVDTGVGSGHPLIDELYQRPRVTPIVDALNHAGIDERDVGAIVNSHLHFDHCGQNSALASVPVFVQAAELTAAQEPGYTIAEWAHTEPGRRRVVDGDECIAPGVTILATPGHTPGHQSVVVERADGRRELVAGQCCYTCAAYRTGTVEPDNLHDESFRAVAAESLDRLRRLAPEAVHFSHDRTVHRAARVGADEKAP